MYKKTLKVYGEDLNYANTPGVVNVGGTMGALAIDLVAIADAETFKATTVQVLQGDDPDDVTEECVAFVSKAASNVKAGDVVASFSLPKDVKTFVTAKLLGTGESNETPGETTNARVTPEYLPR